MIRNVMLGVIAAALAAVAAPSLASTVLEARPPAEPHPAAAAASASVAITIATRRTPVIIANRTDPNVAYI
jgi:hypothetical protein